MNSSQQASAIAKAVSGTQKQTIDAAIVSNTLDTMHKTAPAKGKKNSGSMSAAYDLNKNVLENVYSEKGAIAKIKG